jgi:hypothetical protein
LFRTFNSFLNHSTLAPPHFFNISVLNSTRQLHHRLHNLFNRHHGFSPAWNRHRTSFSSLLLYHLFHRSLLPHRSINFLLVSNPASLQYHHHYQLRRHHSFKTLSRQVHFPIPHLLTQSHHQSIRYLRPPQLH